jgi:hypothetical protein
MNIKSLLLGSAAGLVAVTGARAADAVVVAEPEPVEYVRVCDVFGEGFFYIPGTETCLSISGYVRYKMGATNDDGFGVDANGNLFGSTPNFEGYEGNGWNKRTRARVNLDARSETEWGTLRGYVRLQADWGLSNVDRDGIPNGRANPFSDGPVAVDQAWLSLGGLRMGYTQSAFAETVFGVTNGGSFSDGSLYYSDQQRHLIQYNFGSDTGLFGVVSLEDDALEGDGYVPDVVGVVGYQAGWAAVWARVGYDNDYTDFGDNGAEESGFGVQLGSQFNIPNSGTSIRLMGWYADSDNAYGTQSPYGDITGGNGAAEWSALASINQQFTEKVSASTGFQYFSNFYEGLSDVKTGRDGYAIDLSVVYEPVQNFEVRAEANYNKVDDLDGTVSGFLWFLRRF